MVSNSIRGVGVVTAQWHKLITILAQRIRGGGKVRRSGEQHVPARTYRGYSIAVIHGAGHGTPRPQGHIDNRRLVQGQDAAGESAQAGVRIARRHQHAADRHVAHAIEAVRVRRRRARVHPDHHRDQGVGDRQVQRVNHRAHDIAAVQMQLDRAHIRDAASHRRHRAGGAVIDLAGPHDLRRGDNRAERRRHI